MNNSRLLQEVSELRSALFSARRENEALREAVKFYANREHLSGEPWAEWEWAEADASNWLSPPTDEAMAVEAGGLARAALAAAQEGRSE